MRLLMFGIAALAGISLASPTAAEDDYPADLAARKSAILVEPTSPWNIDFGDSRCRLGRLFGNDEDPYALFIEQTGPSSGFSITLAGAQLKRFQKAKYLEMAMERDEPIDRYEYFTAGELGNIGPAVIFTAVTLKDPIQSSNSSASERAQRSAKINLDEAATVDRFVLKRLNRIVSFETGNMKAPLEALNRCSRSFLIDWGLDPEKHDLYTPAKWRNSEEVIREIVSRYPLEALKQGEQGIFRMRVIIEKDGSVSDCMLDNATINESLQSPACEEMSAAQFEPALDENGQPMRSFYITNINYRIGIRCPGNTRIC